MTGISSEMQSRIMRRTPRRGLTLIPVLVSIVLLSIFLGLLAQRQVRGHQLARRAERKAVAVQVARSERDRISALKKAGKTVASGRRVLTGADISSLAEPVAIEIAAAAAGKSGHRVTVKIPADALANFVSEALDVP